MTNVNWVKDAEYRETEWADLNEFFTTVWNSFGEVFIHDTEVSDDQPPEYLRVLDDSPDVSWVEWEHDVNDEYPVVARKKQKDGRVLIKVDESYSGFELNFDQFKRGALATKRGKRAAPPLYLLVKDLLVKDHGKE